MAPLAVVALVGFSILGSASVQAPCGQECTKVPAGGLTFDCRQYGPKDATTKILLVHGFPNWSVFWLPLLQRWAQENPDWRAVACDMHGYSPGASPDDINAYDYVSMAGDVEALADALHYGDKFHLIGHDHGAGSGWIAASRLSHRLLSWTGMSGPHLDAFSAALYGKDADQAQQAASNYFRQWMLPDSANKTAVLFGGHLLGFPTVEAFQKSLWWCHGMYQSGYSALVPVLDDATIAKYPVPMVQEIRQLIPLPVDAGAPQKKAVGKITVPTLFVCGTEDPYLLCSRPWVAKTSQLALDYQHVNVKCGHDLLHVAKDCDQQAVDIVMRSITDHIKETQKAIGPVNAAIRG